MGYRLLADLTVLFHGLFILFVLAGGWLAFRWRAIVWFHVPAMLWGASIEFMGWMCPLTPLENWFRSMSDREAYDSDFVQHYLIPVIYPASLTRPMQFLFGGLVLGVNLMVYVALWRRARAKHAVV